MVSGIEYGLSAHAGADLRDSADSCGRRFIQFQRGGLGGKCFAVA